MDETRLKVVTRTFFEGTSLDNGNPGGHNSRDTRYLTQDELSSYLRAIQVDAFQFGTHGSVNVNGQPYASFEPSRWASIPRCDLCTVRHLSRCLSAPDPSTCQHDFSIITSLPNKLMGAIHSWTQYHACRLCGALSAFTPVTPAFDVMAEARAWVADCTWADGDTCEYLSDDTIRHGIERHYEGGWAAFIASCGITS
jgi:hypothetical protein